MQASEHDLHELLEVKAATQNTALAPFLNPSTFATKTTIDIIVL
jgi:hypothetical protein